MLQKMYTPLRFTAIMSWVFVFALSIAWADEDDDDVQQKNNGGSASEVTYSASEDIEKGDGTAIDVVNEGEKIIKIWVDSGSLDAYMTEQGIDDVELTVTLVEHLVQRDDGTSHYQLDFIFGPSGAHFSTELEVRLEHAYYDSDVWMYSEDGEALETYEHGSDGKLYFLVPHFSRYS